MTVFGPCDVTLEARVLDLSGRGMRVLLDRPLRAGVAVKVETRDTLLLGEVRYSAASGQDFEVGLHLQHSLVGLKELTRLNQRLLNGVGQDVILQPIVNRR